MPPLTLLDGVRWRGEPVVGERPRALLEALAAADPSGSSSSSLAEAVWGADQPANPTKSLQVLVSRVRTATDTRVIERTARGYRLGLARDEVDVLARADLVAEARSAYEGGRPDDAARAARASLALGPSDDARRVLAMVSSHTGDHGAAFPLLEELATRDPSDEDLLACLLRSEAVVRGPAAALERYERHRADLAGRLGSDPGPALQAVHRELLAADRPVREGVRFDGTPLLGRDGDLRALHAMLHESRAVSMVGAGGLGKTRLAHVLGREADQPIVQFVELVGVTASEDVVGEVGSALGVRDSVTGRRTLTPGQGSDLRSRIAQQLGSAPSLLILDNCEHVVGAVADLVAYLVATTPDVRVLTTTRAPLGIGAERVYALGQLPAADAVELFRQRATAARPAAVLDEPAVADIVTRLDGLPLAIELAAAKVRVMSVEDIGRRLESRFALLRGGDRSAPDRHQTLLAVIDWSWNLLTEPQRRALTWLSVFHDGFTLDAAEAMLGPAALDAVEGLVNQSLLSVDETGASLRYRMLETVREFGRMQLVDAGDDGAAERAQLVWACAYVDTYGAGLMGPGQFEAMDAIHDEETNLADVLRRALTEPDPESVVVLLAALGTVWTVRGEHLRVIALVEAFEESIVGWAPPEACAEHARAALTLVLTNAAIADPGPLPNAQALLERMGPHSTDPRIAAICTVMLSIGFHTPGGLRFLSERSPLERLSEDPDRHVALQALQLLGHVRENDADLDGAIDAATRALALAREEDGPWQRALLHTQLAEWYGRRGEHERAAGYAAQALPVLDRLAATDDAIQNRAVLGLNAAKVGRPGEAHELFTQIANADHRRLGFGGSSILAIARAELALLEGDERAGLAGYRTVAEGMREGPLSGLVEATGFEATGFEPWVLLGESAALAAHALHGEEHDGEDLWASLRERILAIVDPSRPLVDYPAAGMALYALALWGLLRNALPPADAVRLLVLADRFAYNRMVPSMSWENAAALAERIAPGLIDELRTEYGDRRGTDLLDEAHAFVSRLFG